MELIAKLAKPYAIALLGTCDGSSGWASLLRPIVADMIRVGASNGIVIGFMGVIGRAVVHSKVLDGR